MKRLSHQGTLWQLITVAVLPALVLACGYTFGDPRAASMATRGFGGAPATHVVSSGSGSEAPLQPAEPTDDSEAATAPKETTASKETAPKDTKKSKTVLTLLSSSSVKGCLPAACRLELVFSEAVSAERVLAALSSKPSLVLSSDSTGLVRRVQISAPFRHSTKYAFTLERTLCTEGDACIKTDHHVAVHTGGGYAAVRMPVHNTVIAPGKKLPMRFEQVASAELTLVPLRAEDVGLALSVAGIHMPEDNPLDALPAAVRARKKTIAITVDDDMLENGKEIDPFVAVGAPLVLAILRAPHAFAKAGVFQRGELSALLKVGRDSGLVWVTDAATGKPVAGARVKVTHGSAVTFEGRTNVQGLLPLPKRSRLRKKDQTAALAAVVQSRTRTAMTSLLFQDGLSSWMFRLPQHAYSGPNAIRGMVTAERGIYRSGESVHLLGILRKRLGNGTLVPPGGRVAITVKDSKGAVQFTRAARLTAFGTVRAKLDLAPHAEIGRYHVTLTHGQTQIRSSFEVGAFRTAAFEVKLPAKFTQGDDDLSVPLSAQYLHGAAVAKGKVTWTASWRHRALAPAGLETFTFVAEANRRPGWNHLTGGEAALAPSGKLEIVIPKKALPFADEATAIDILIEATVADAANDSITARAVMRHVRSGVAIGTRSKQWVVSPKSGWTVDLVAVRDGKAVAGQTIEVDLYRTFWSTVAEKGPHGVRYRSSREHALVKSQSFTSQAKPISSRFDIPGGGSYELRVRSKDGGYELTRRVWAHGSEATAPARNSPRMRLHLDKSSYDPGDVAKIHAENPYAKATALVTMERAGVISARVMEMEGAETPIDMRLELRHMPNVFVSVTVVPRSDGSAKRPAGNPLIAGYKELRVSPERRRLKVEVTPVERTLRPGEGAVAKVTVRDHQGKPVRAEVTLWAADEGVLMLTGYQTPDPFAPVYASHALEVTSALNLLRWMSTDPNLWLDGGGDSGGPTSALRSRMLHTAFFSKGVVTNARGEATVKFDVPDNLTRWRLMAVAADKGQRFGRGEAAIRVSKPLAIMAALPRFLTSGDMLDAGFVVHNQTGAPVAAKVSLAVSGAELVGGAAVTTVQVPSGGQQALSFPVVARAPGTVSFTVKVTAGQHSDALRVRLPAQVSTIAHQELVSAGEIATQVARTIDIPQSARAGSAELFVTVSPSVLAALEPSIQALLDYPHGCAEQKTSRLVPMIVLGDMVRDLRIDGFDQQRHRERLQATLGELLEHQNEDGGFGLWPESDTDPFITAYVLFGMTVARAHDFAIHDKSYARGVAYLQGLLENGKLSSGYFEYDPNVFTAYVLALAGKTDHGLADRMFEGRKDMSQLERALLASTLLQRKSNKADVLLKELAAAYHVDKGIAVLEETKVASYYAHGADIRTTAAAAEAFSRAGRTEDASRLVLGLLGERGSNGTWGTTHNNLWALYAVSAYADKTAPLTSIQKVRVSIGRRQLGVLTLGSGRTAARLNIPASALPAPGGAAVLTLTAAAGTRPHFAIRMRYMPKRKGQGAVSRGYEVTREIVDAATGDPVASPKAGQLLRMRVTVKIDAYRHQVAVVDRLPAGLEPVDPKLATSQRGASSSGYAWVSTKMRDESVSFFAYGLRAGSHTVEYLARATRTGDFIWPAAHAESMYQPNERGRTAISHLVVVK